MKDRPNSYNARDVMEQDRLDAIDRAYSENLKENRLAYFKEFALAFDDMYGWDRGKTLEWLVQSEEVLGLEKLVDIVFEELEGERPDPPSQPTIRTDPSS